MAKDPGCEGEVRDPLCDVCRASKAEVMPPASDSKMQQINQKTYFSFLLEVQLVRKVIVVSHSQLVIYWCYGLVGRISNQSKVSVNDEPGVRIKNQTSKINMACTIWQFG